MFIFISLFNRSRLSSIAFVSQHFSPIMITRLKQWKFHYKYICCWIVKRNNYFWTLFSEILGDSRNFLVFYFLSWDIFRNLYLSISKLSTICDENHWKLFVFPTCHPVVTNFACWHCTQTIFHKNKEILETTDIPLNLNL